MDAVGKESWIAQSPKEFGFEQFPELKWFVRTNYLPLPDAHGLHYYIRDDLAKRASSVPQPRHCAATALRCLEVPERNYIFDASLVSSVAYLPPLQLPEHARLKMEVIPMAKEQTSAVILGNGEPDKTCRGVRLEYLDTDRYQLVLGVATSWARSTPFHLPYGKSSSLQIDLEPVHVSLQVNGAKVSDMSLSSPFANTKAPFTIGSGSGERTRFTGVIPFFEIESVTLP